jgi:hypothetical protein
MAHALVRRKEVQGWRGEIRDGEVLADRVSSPGFSSPGSTGAYC